VVCLIVPATTDVPYRSSAALPLGFTDGQVEALKWIGIASMFLDHFGRHLIGYGQDSWVFAAGRIAFPLFAFVLAVNLARAGDRAARAARTARRPALWGAISVVPSVLARGEPMLLNVLFTLMLGAALCWALASRASMSLRAALCLGIAVASWFVEFALGGVFLVVAIYLWCTERQPGVLLLAVILLLATGWLNATNGGWPAMLGTLACAPIAWAVHQMPVSVPRFQMAFYLIYPLHLGLIGLLKTQP
jgi:hypothetical protein